MARQQKTQKKLKNRFFHTKVHGITHRNPDGSERQRIARRCKFGQGLLLIRDPGNPHDPNAIQVWVKGSFLRRRQQVGFLSAELAEELAPVLDAGGTASAAVAQRTGGSGFLWWKKYYGVNILVVIQP